MGGGCVWWVVGVGGVGWGWGGVGWGGVGWGGGVGGGGGGGGVGGGAVDYFPWVGEYALGCTEPAVYIDTQVHVHLK